MTFHDSGKTRKETTIRRATIDTEHMNRVCLHCGQRYGRHRGLDSACPPWS